MGKVNDDVKGRVLEVGKMRKMNEERKENRVVVVNRAQHHGSGFSCRRNFIVLIGRLF